MSLRAKLIVLVLALTTALLGGLGLYLSRALGGWSEEVLDQELLHRADGVASEVKWEHGEIEVDEDAEENAQGWPFRVETMDGAVLASARFDWPKMGPAREVPSFETLSTAGGAQVRVLTRTFQPHHGRGQALVLRMAAPVSAFAPVAERFRGGLAVALVLAAVLGALGAAGIAQFFLRPLRRLSREAAGIEADTLHQRLPLDGLDPELRRLASAFNGVLDRLESAFEGQRALVGRASHALRTPLASILSRAEVALRRERSAEESRKSLEDIASAAREAANLASGLLALTRADAANAPRHPERIRAPELAEEIDRLFRPRADQAGLELITSAEDTAFEADRGRVREMLDAIVDNALRYTPRGGRVAFRAAGLGDAVLLEVTDTGPGIPSEERPKVTERFFRGEAAQASAQPGTGLGLSLVQKLAEGERARLSIGDAPGGGARISLEFAAAGAAPP